MVERARNLIIGDPFDSKTEIGPLISKEQIEKVMSFAQTAEESDDTNILCGGKRCESFQTGYYFEPTIVETKSNQNTVCQEEMFGPCATILEFDGIDEAIELANDSEFGLVSYVWSTDIRKIMRAQAEIRAGVVWVNTPLMRELRAPFGGYKNSGIGRDGGEWSRNLFTEEKTVSIPLKDFPITKLGENN